MAFVNSLPFSHQSSKTSKPLHTSRTSVCVLDIRPDSKTGTAAPKAAGASLVHDVSEAARAARKAQLAEKQKQYIYESPDTLPDVAFLKSIEGLEAEQTRLEWKLKVNQVTQRIAANKPDASGPHLLLKSILSPILKLAPGERKKRKLTNQYDKLPKQIAEKLIEYRDLYPCIPFPNIANHFMDDQIFGRLRVAGYNPMTLFAVSNTNCPFEIPDHRCLSGDSFASAIAESRMYAVDFSVLATVEQERQSARRFAVTKALFAVPRGAVNADLVPLAIEVNGDIVYPPRPEEPEFSASWELAKLAVNVCDAMHHQLIAHLSRTHLLVEAFIMATMRQLPKEHPVYKILRPHFEGTAFINETASGNLVKEGGPVDKVLAGTLDTGISLVTHQMNNFDFNGGFPDVELAARGLRNPNLNMPYREDALMHYEALTEWVYDYLSLYYDSEDDVRSDVELAAWARELCDPEGGRLKNFGSNGDGKIHDLKYLSQAVAFVIFSGSCQHACVNFPQGSVMLFPAAVAGFINDEVPDFSTEISEDQLLHALSPRKAAILQIEQLGRLGLIYHTKLGHYRAGELPNDPRVKEALKKYRRKLDGIEKKIVDREKDEPVKYEFLKPSNVPQSTNI